ncbi:MAG: TlpA family protein disulfide reductase [Spirosomataceae bacterium]
MKLQNLKFIFVFLIPMLSMGQFKTVSPQDTTDFILKAGNASVLQKSRELLAKAEHQQFIEEFNKKFAKDFDDEFQYAQLMNKNVDDWEMDLYDRRLKQADFFKTYPLKSQLSADFQKWVENQIRWNYWHQLLAYSIIRSNKDTKLTRVVSLPSVMTEALDPAKVNDETALTSEAYRNFLPFFVTYFNSKSNGFLKYGSGANASEQSASNVQGVTDKASIAQQYLKGDVLDYTLTKLLYDNCGRLTPTSAKYWIGQVKSANYQAILNEHCKETLTRVEVVETKKKEEKPKNRAESGDLPLLTDMKGNKFSFADFKGKVIYVDFWASWCGPCRQQFPFSKQMHDGLNDKEKKKVVFLYISIDEDLDAWKNAVQQLKLDNGENGHSIPAAQKYQVNSIPRYMIIDKNGNIVNPNAPRPSDPSALELLKKLMNEV